jgi:hypothetical protein
VDSFLAVKLAAMGRMSDALALARENKAAFAEGIALSPQSEFAGEARKALGLDVDPAGASR